MSLFQMCILDNIDMFETDTTVRGNAVIVVIVISLVFMACLIYLCGPSALHRMWMKNVRGDSVKIFMPDSEQLINGSVVYYVRYGEKVVKCLVQMP